MARLHYGRCSRLAGGMQRGHDCTATFEERWVVLLGRGRPGP